MTDEYGSFIATRRNMRPLDVLPSAKPVSLETTYQYSYFEQSDAPRACGATRGAERVRPKEKPSVIGSVIEQSRTTMSDAQPTTLTAYRNPRKIDASKPSVRFEKIQQPKQFSTQYPVPLEPTRMRLK